MTIPKLLRASYFLSTMVWLVPTSAVAAPIEGLTYTYDLSQSDLGTGAFTTAYVRNNVPTEADDTVDDTDLSTITSSGMLTDGDFGDALTHVPFGNQSVLFPNGTYAGFENPGFGGAPHPKIDIDLGDSYQLQSFTLYYLVEDDPSIFSPQPVPDGAGGNLFNALTVSGSADGVNFSELAFTNAFNPIIGIGGDLGSGVEEVRAATFDLTGNTMSYLSIDIRTPDTFIFLSEFVVEGTIVVGTPGDFDFDSDVDGNDFLVWQRDTTVGSLTDWQSQFGTGVGTTQVGTAVPEPSGWLFMTWGAYGLLSGQRRDRNISRIAPTGK